MNKAINIITAFVAVALFYQMKLHKWTDLSGTAREEFLPEFLIGVNWTTSLDHMVNKWQTACGGTKDSYGYFMRFYSDLDKANQERLVTWAVSKWNIEHSF